MEVNEQMQVLGRKRGQAIVIKIHMDQTLKRNPLCKKFLHPQIGKVGLPRPPHALDDRRIVPNLREPPSPSDHVMRNAICIKLRHDFT